LGRLGKKLAALRTPISPFDGQGLPRSGVHWVKPKLVAQIAFTEWTREGKLRHPRFLGLREDKKPEEVVHGRADHVLEPGDHRRGEDALSNDMKRRGRR
jgi:ATP-dependent DNA ligase